MSGKTGSVLEPSPPGTMAERGTRSTGKFSTGFHEFTFDTSEHSNSGGNFDEYCRSRGARDLIELFRINYRGGLLAEIVRNRFLEQLWARIRSFVSENDPQEHIFVGSSDRPATDLQDETIWNVICLYFRNYTIVATDVHDWYVPVFCAHPTPGPDGKFKLAYSEAIKSEFGFKLGVPGLWGGFGAQRSVTFGLQTEEYSVAFQLQAKMSFQITTWSNDRVDVRTVFPLERVGTREVTADNRAYFLDYDRSAKITELRDPHEVRSESGSWMKYDVEIGAKDVFEIKLPDGFGKLAIDSEATEGFTVEHYLHPNHEYRWRGMHGKCHDVFVSAETLE